MNRRDFTKTTLAGALATLLPSLPEPRFSEVDWIKYHSGEPFDCDLTYCDVCVESFIEDNWANRPTRKFFHDSREQLIVCEHCLPGYLEGEQTHART